VVYGDEVHPSHEYLEDYAGLLLLSSSLPEEERLLGAEELLAMIKKKFFREGYLFHSSEPRFESLSLWQDTPIPSGGAMLLSALLNLGKKELEGLDRLGISEIAARNPSFFGLWCSALDRAHAGIRP
jgi:hypothetical protein